MFVSQGAFAEFLSQHITSEDISEIEDTSIIEGLQGVVGPLNKISRKRQNSRSEREESDFEAVSSDAGRRLGRTLSTTSSIHVCSRELRI
jgi:hypothetical protein